MLIIWNAYKKVIGFFLNIGIAIAGLCILSMIILIFTEIIGRAVFGFSTLISDELSGYLLVATVFFGAAYTLKNGGIIRVDFIYEMIPKKNRNIIDIFLEIVVLIYLGILLNSSWKYAGDSFRLKSISTTILETPLWIPQSTIVIGIILLIFEMTILLGDSIIDSYSRSLPG